MERIKTNQKLAITVLLGVLVGLLVSFVSIKQKTPCTGIGNKCYYLERVTSQEGRSTGLSGRSAIDKDKGMLFVFDSPDKQCMWMKDMSFPLDMVWLDSKGKVLNTEENISPDTYPESFCSEDDAVYVIELNAGEIADSNLQIGDFVVVN